MIIILSACVVDGQHRTVTLQDCFSVETTGCKSSKHSCEVFCFGESRVNHYYGSSSNLRQWRWLIDPGLLELSPSLPGVRIVRLP